MSFSELVLRGVRGVGSLLPASVQRPARRFWNAQRIRFDQFSSPEPEFARLAEWVRPGDWVVDVGANVGHYTLRLAELVGSTGRVLAFEPVPETFAVLAANCDIRRCRNVTLFNAAASGQAHVVAMSIPTYEDGLNNYYQARIEAGGPGATGSLEVLAVPFDGLAIPRAIALIKIDAEGHEDSVLAGMEQVLRRDWPRVIMENTSSEAVERLRALGYEITVLAGSPNVVCVAARRP